MTEDASRLSGCAAYAFPIEGKVLVESERKTILNEIIDYRRGWLNKPEFSRTCGRSTPNNDKSRNIRDLRTGKRGNHSRVKKDTCIIKI